MDRARRAYALITAAYWAFMASDGALRMLVLLQFHLLGYTPLSLASLFLLYEAMGVVTNLYAGWLAKWLGLFFTLIAGLVLQIAALLGLSLFSADWTPALAAFYVVLVQALAGIAKDLTKMSAKSAVKSLARDGGGQLFRWVALLTGAKNAIKGLGFFIGAGLLAAFGFSTALVILATCLGLALFLVLLSRPELPEVRAKTRFRQMFSRDPAINRLSLARFFLFGSRDCWFVVAVPIFLYASFAARGEAAFTLVGAFMAAWVILYGGVQSLAPRILRRWPLGLSQLAGLLCLFTLILGVFANLIAPVLLMALLFVFGILFALNSSLHSYLILACSKAENVTMDVGFYYMSNAAGRLFGTLLSGLTYQIAGLTAALLAASLLSGLSMIAARSMEVPQGERA